MSRPAREPRLWPTILRRRASLLARSAAGGVAWAAFAAAPAAGQSAPGATPAATPAAVPADAARSGVVRGVVYDSAAGLPLAGAVVQLVPAGQTAERVVSTVADSGGAFRVAGLAPGAWVVGFTHAALDAYGFEMPAGTVRVAAGDSLTLTLGLPGPEGLHRAVCGAAAAAPAGADEVGGVAGVVRDADTELPAAGARVAIGWSALEVANGVHLAPRRVTVTTAEDGSFSACGLPSGVGLAVRVEAGASGDSTQTSGEVELTLAAGTLTRLALAAGRSEAVPLAVAATAAADSAPRAAAGRVVRGEARLVGTVLDPQGAPVPNARISVRDTERETVTNETGAFVLTDLPSGTWTVEARALGFTPTRASVVLSRTRPARLALDLTAPVWTLKGVTVVAKTSMRARLLDELHRRARHGRLITEEELERRRVSRMSDALSVMPGFRVLPVYQGGVGQVVRGRMNCVPSVFVDGLPLMGGADQLDFMIHPSMVLAVEVYSSFGGIPAQYAGVLGGRPCGVVGIWTKR